MTRPAGPPRPTGPPRRAARTAAAAGAALLVLGGCGASRPTAPQAATTPAPPAVPRVTPAGTPTARAPRPAAARHHRAAAPAVLRPHAARVARRSLPPPAAPRAVRPARPAVPPAAPANVPAVLRTLPAATTQALLERSASAAATVGTVTGWARGPGGWDRVLGPWPADLGYHGTAPVGAKREGDGRTPAGTFGFSYLFGVQPDPGVHYAYRTAGPQDYWDDDPASARYNTWVTGTAQAGRNPEPMDNPAPYAYGAVIAYNTARTPGAGSAIFFHVATGGSTAGCVAVPRADLLTALRWLRPGADPVIDIAVGG